VLCGDTDITEDIKPYLPNPFGVIKKISTVAAGLVAVLVIGYIISIIWPRPNPIVEPVKMRPAVVLVYTNFYYTLTLDDNPISSEWDGTITLSNLTEISGTAFFIDREGHLGTNRHVATPWADGYREKELDDYIKLHYNGYIDEILKFGEEITWENRQLLLKSDLGTKILKVSQHPDDINKILYRIRHSSYKISGIVRNRAIGYPGRNYTNPVLEMERCDLIAESGTDDKDVAILQLNSKKTPDDIGLIFDINNLSDSKLEPLKDNLYMIGYPKGLTWGQDNVTHSLEPVIRSLRCSKVPSRYDFEFEGESVGGASGSPIFDDEGRLVGVLWGRWAAGTTYGKACQAKWLKELYDKEVKY
jgi:hypothetical protein